MIRVVHVRDNVPGAVYIGRRARLFSRGWVEASLFANPFKIGPDGDRAAVIAKYRDWLVAQPTLVAQAKRELRGKVLACWCAPLACHGDVLLEIANQPADDTAEGRKG